MNDCQPFGRYLACRSCSVLVPASLPGEVGLGAAAEEVVLAVQEFFAEHGSHDLCELQRTATDSWSGGPLWDPMATLWIELTDGKRCYVACARRGSIDEPRRYVFAPRTLEVIASQIDIDEADVRRGLDLEFFPHAVRPTKIDEFVGAVHEVLRGIDAQELEIAYVDAQDPSVSVARLPEQALRRLLTASAKIFDSWELARVQHFLEANRCEDGALALRVRRQAMVNEE